MNLALFIPLALGYALGLLNFSWLLHRFVVGSDLSTKGTGNLGARNLYDVSGNRWLAIAAGVMDCLKGIAAVLATNALFDNWFDAAACAGVGVVLGHNYNFLLQWKGGRGLAAATGVGLLLCPPFVFTWGVMYLIGFVAIRRNLYVATMTATLATAVLALSVPEPVFTATSMYAGADVWHMRWTVVAILFPVFVRFIDPMREYLRTAPDDEDE